MGVVFRKWAWFPKICQTPPLEILDPPLPIAMGSQSVELRGHSLCYVRAPVVEVNARSSGPIAMGSQSIELWGHSLMLEPF